MPSDIPPSIAHGRVLQAYLEGTLDAEALAMDLRSPWRWRGTQSRELLWKDQQGPFRLEVQHLVKLCDAVLSGSLLPDRLEAIAFGILASDSFDWADDDPAGERIANTLHDWSCPEINYDLNVKTVAKFRERLLTGFDTFTPED